ncbi:MAG: dienelactone hydrolase family protein [Acidimicrobiia bacterium]|jgi:dienelactone hydrolase|nr:dienelactone hydrolase family protein [Acidimicrobiia bacterium]
MHHRRLTPLLAAAAALTLGLALDLPAPAAGAPSPKGARPDAVGTVPAGVTAPFAKPGPFPVGVTTLDLGDRKIEVWYPADPKATNGKQPDTYFLRDRLPPAIAALLPADINPPKETTAFRDVAGSKRGPFPLVTFSHGAAGYREQSTFLTTHLASWGFVVASPEFLEFGLTGALGQRPAAPRTNVEVLQSTVERVREASASRPGVLSGLARKGKIGAVGHSAGARASIELAAADPSVATYVALAGDVGAFSAGETTASTLPAVVAPDIPSMFIAGREDGIADLARIKEYYASAPTPKRLVVITGSGHLNAFSDICTIGEGGGGVVAIAQQAGLPVPSQVARLGTDGCRAPALPSGAVQPVVKHYTVAQLRFALGFDKAPVGLAPRSAKQFGDVDVAYSVSTGRG